MLKVLILCDNQILNLDRRFNTNSYEVFQQPIYFNCNFFLRVIRKIHLLSIIPFKSIWYSKCINEKKTFYDVVVLFDSILSENALSIVQSNFRDSRLIFWYWNLVKKNTDPKIIRKYNYELWTFDEIESSKYNLKFNTQFYYPRYIENFPNKTDVFFIGRDFNRINKLFDLQSLFDKLGIVYNFIIVKSNRYSFLRKRNKSETSKIVSYSKVIEHISESSCILELNQSNQVGLTIRALEALFYSKKLITDNANIMKYDFYRSDNIFIIGKDNYDDLISFVRSPYCSVDQAIINNYSLNSWISRFIDDYKQE